MLNEQKGKEKKNFDSEMKGEKVILYYDDYVGNECDWIVFRFHDYDYDFCFLDQIDFLTKYWD